MYIFEGRGKGATWSLLLEALHNQGVYVVAHNSHFLSLIKESVLSEMLREKAISIDGYAYLEENVFTLEEWKKSERRGRDTKVYFDMAITLLSSTLYNELGAAPEAIALGNDDFQIIHPAQIKEMKNTYIVEQREYFGREN